jgi:hypothetical protein
VTDPSEGAPAPAEHHHTAAFRGASFRMADLTGATFRECDLRDARIVGSMVAGLRITGFDGETGSVVVDDVDVADFVAATLDERHPERVQLRAIESADDHRAMWATIERLWGDTLDRGRALPEPSRHERVDGEWSLVETVRHLVFAIDSWVGNLVLGRERPYHPLGLPPTDFDPADNAAHGLDVEASPSFDEASALLAERQAMVRDVLAGLDDAGLAEERTGVLAPQFGDETHPLGACLRVVRREHVEHRRFIERDLAVLRARP